MIGERTHPPSKMPFWVVDDVHGRWNAAVREMLIRRWIPHSSIGTSSALLSSTAAEPWVVRRCPVTAPEHAEPPAIVINGPGVALVALRTNDLAKSLAILHAWRTDWPAGLLIAGGELLTAERSAVLESGAGLVIDCPSQLVSLVPAIARYRRRIESGFPSAVQSTLAAHGPR